MRQSEALHAAADALLESYETHQWCAPVRNLIGGSVEAGYAVQQINTARWLAQGRKVIGRKIGLTSTAVQKQLGVNQPDFGVLFSDMVFGDGTDIPAQRVHQPRVEAEIAIVLGRDITTSDPCPVDILAAADHIAPALEIVGSRIRNWDIQISDTIADNASAGLLVVGEPLYEFRALDLDGCRMTLVQNGTLASEGTGSACLGHPLNAAVWLAKKQIELGSPLRAGDLILTGALGPMVNADPGDHFRALISGIGEVTTRFARQSRP